MRTIWKFAFLIRDEFSLWMPKGAEILHADVQQGQEGQACLWALVHTDALSVDRYFSLRGTGHNALGLTSGHHVSTFQAAGGALVWHLFDLGEQEPTDG